MPVCVQLRACVHGHTRVRIQCVWRACVYVHMYAWHARCVACLFCSSVIRFRSRFNLWTDLPIGLNLPANPQKACREKFTGCFWNFSFTALTLTTSDAFRSREPIKQYTTSRLGLVNCSRKGVVLSLKWALQIQCASDVYKFSRFVLISSKIWNSPFVQTRQENALGAYTTCAISLRHPDFRVFPGHKT